MPFPASAPTSVSPAALYPSLIGTVAPNLLAEKLIQVRIGRADTAFLNYSRTPPPAMSSVLSAAAPLNRCRANGSDAPAQDHKNACHTTQDLHIARRSDWINTRLLAIAKMEAMRKDNLYKLVDIGTLEKQKKLTRQIMQELQFSKAAIAREPGRHATEKMAKINGGLMQVETLHANQSHWIELLAYQSGTSTTEGSRQPAPTTQDKPCISESTHRSASVEMANYENTHAGKSCNGHSAAFQYELEAKLHARIAMQQSAMASYSTTAGPTATLSDPPSHGPGGSGLNG